MIADDVVVANSVLLRGQDYYADDQHPVKLSSSSSAQKNVFHKKMWTTPQRMYSLARFRPFVISTSTGCHAGLKLMNEGIKGRIQWRCEACGASGSFEPEPTDADAGYQRMLELHRQQSPDCGHANRIRARVGQKEVLSRPRRAGA
jgi:hypothetical protein